MLKYFPASNFPCEYAPVFCGTVVSLVWALVPEAVTKVATASVRALVNKHDAWSELALVCRHLRTCRSGNCTTATTKATAPPPPPAPSA